MLFRSSVALMQQVILELKVHTALEEEHHVAKALIGEIEELGMDDENASAKFQVLVENVRHHIKEEEGEMFPKIEDEDLNEELVDQLLDRKAALMAEVGDEMGMPIPPEGGHIARPSGRA